MNCNSDSRLTPRKVEHQASLYRYGTCPNCGNVVSEFEKWGEQTVHITVAYCKFCGQALDWEGFSTELPKQTALRCPHHNNENGTCRFDESYHCDFIELCKFKPPSGSNTPDA